MVTEAEITAELMQSTQGGAFEAEPYLDSFPVLGIVTEMNSTSAAETTDLHPSPAPKKVLLGHEMEEAQTEALENEESTETHSGKQIAWYL